jgi:uncharacterized protein YdeI (YjbR/CyaY-like superfamily)
MSMASKTLASAEILEFADKAQFHGWLQENVTGSAGIWIRFHKAGKKTISAEEALDLSLCYGWIDGQMKSEGPASYLKYFAPRSPNSKWSDKNKQAIARLRAQNTMTSHGEAEVQKAIQNGQWDKAVDKPDFDKMIGDFAQILADDAPLLAKFQGASQSDKKRFVGFYFEAKSAETKAKRLEKIKTTLLTGGKGMLY